MRQFTRRLIVWLRMSLLLARPMCVAATLPSDTALDLPGQGGTVNLYLPGIRNAALTPIGPLTITNPLISPARPIRNSKIIILWPRSNWGTW